MGGPVTGTMIGTTRRLAGSATINTWISFVVRLGGMMLLLPLVLRHLDLAQVLVWQLLASITAMLVWIDFGITPTFSRFIAIARGGGRLGDLMAAHRSRNAALRGFTPADPPAGPAAAHPVEGRPLTLAGVVATSERIYAIMALLGTLVVAGIGTWAVRGPIAALADPAQGWMAWGFAALSVPFALLNSASASVLIGCDRITPLRRAEMLVGAAQLLSTSAVVLATADLGWIAATYYVWTPVQFALNRWLRRLTLAAQGGGGYGRPAAGGSGKALPPHTPAGGGGRKRLWARRDPAAPRFDPALFRAAWAAGWRSGVGVLFSTGIIQGSGLILPQIAPAEIAAAYLIVLRLMTIASQLSQAPFYSRLPAMAKANAEGRRDKVVAIAIRGLRLSLWTMVIGIAGIIFLVPQILHWIGGAVRIADPVLSLLLGLAFFAERYGGMHMQLYTLSNHVIWHRVNGATGVAIIAAFALLWPLVGAWAMPLAMLAGYGLYLCPTVSRRALAFLGEARWPFERRTALGPALGLLACVLLFLLGRALAWPMFLPPAGVAPLP